MIKNKFIKKIILYGHIRDSENRKNINIIKDLILCNKIVCRKSPSILLNSKKEIIGTKNTLRNKQLNTFLYKLIIFIIPKIKKDTAVNSNIIKFDNNLNIDMILRNKTYFFEYGQNLFSDFDYTFIVKIIFYNKINIFRKLDYINEILKINFK